MAVKLVKDGYNVIGLVRSIKRPKILNNINIQYCFGDLLNPETYEASLEQCNTVIHTAALTAFGLGDPREYYRVNFEGTKTLLACAKRNGIQRFIHTSTRGVLGVSSHPNESDEDCVLENFEKKDDYIKSKYLAQKAVLDNCRKSGIDCIVLAPTALIGTFDEKPTPIGNIILSFLLEKITFYMDGGINIIDVEDAAKGFISAVNKGVNGQVYIIGNENITLYEIFKKLSKISGKPPPKFKLPYLIAYIASSIFPLISKVTGKPPFTTPNKVVSLYNNYSYCNPGKAQKVLELPGTKSNKTLEKVVNWYKENFYY